MTESNKEIWKEIPGYEGYYVCSNMGRVKSLERTIEIKHYHRNIKSKILNPTINTVGYLVLNLCKDVQKLHYVHQLVAMTFLNHKPNRFKLIVDHINNDRLDNRIDNLQLITNRENCSKDQKPSASKYTGVCWSKKSKKWRARIYINGKNKHLGLFTDEYKAYLACQRELNLV